MSIVDVNGLEIGKVSVPEFEFLLIVKGGDVTFIY